MNIPCSAPLLKPSKIVHDARGIIFTYSCKLQQGIHTMHSIPPQSALCAHCTPPLPRVYPCMQSTLFLLECILHTLQSIPPPVHPWTLLSTSPLVHPTYIASIPPRMYPCIECTLSLLECILCTLQSIPPPVHPCTLHTTAPRALHPS